MKNEYFFEKKTFIRALTPTVSCHHEETLNYKFKHKTANKSLSDADQWISGSSTQAIKMDCGVATHKWPNVFSHYRS